MAFTPLQLGNGSKSAPKGSGRPPREMHGHSVGEQLEVAFAGRYSIAWLAEQLGCDVTKAAMLASWWIVPSPKGRVHALLVFSRMLGINSECMLKLFEEADQAPALSAAPKATAAPAREPEKSRLVTIGSNDGTREIRQVQPRIEWRKPRRTAVTSE